MIQITKIEIRNHPDIFRLKIELKNKLLISGELDLSINDIYNVFYLLNIMNNNGVLRQWCNDNLEEDSKPVIINISYLEHSVQYRYEVSFNKNNILYERVAVSNHYTYKDDNPKELLGLPENTKDLFQSIHIVDFDNDKWEEMFIEEAISQCIEFKDSDYFQGICKSLRELKITQVPLDIRNQDYVMYYDIFEEKYINIKDADSNVKQCFILVTLVETAKSLNCSLMVLNQLEKTILDYSKRKGIMDFITAHMQLILIDINLSQYKATFKETEKEVVVVSCSTDNNYVINLQL